MKLYSQQFLLTVVKNKEKGAMIEEIEPIQFHCNKPYIYMIRENKTGRLLFILIIL